MNCQLKIALRHFCHRRNLSPLLFKAEPATRPPPSLPLSLSARCHHPTPDPSPPPIPCQTPPPQLSFRPATTAAD